MTQCSSMDRNFCTPNGKVAALFLDLDGTIMHSQVHFDEAADSFGHFMSLLKFDYDEAKAHFNKLNLSMTTEYGFRRELFANIMVQAYRQLCKIKRRRFTAEANMKNENILRNIGNGPFFREPVLFQDTRQVLGRARNVFLIIAVSIGSRDAQKYKISQAGLKATFDHTIFTAKDNKLDYVRQAIKDFNIDPEYSAFIGNSIRSDGACLAATNFIHLPLETGWAFDSSKDLPQDTGFLSISATDWSEAEEMGINSLLRRRKVGKPTAGARGKNCRCS